VDPRHPVGIGVPQPSADNLVTCAVEQGEEDNVTVMAIDVL
jgi:serine/threonine protein phosphatase PrpC